MKRPQSPSLTKCEKISKKIKHTKENVQEEDIFLDMDKAWKSDRLKKAIQLVTHFKKEDDSQKQALTEYSLKELLLAFTMCKQEEDHFQKRFSKCASSLINTIKKENDDFYMAMDNFLVQFYDYKKNAKTDFSVINFDEYELDFSHPSWCVLDILKEYPRWEIQKEFYRLVETLLKGDMDKVTIFYSSQLLNFVAMYKIIDSPSSIKKIHNACIQTIFQKIKNIDVKDCKKKFNIHLTSKTADSDSDDDCTDFFHMGLGSSDTERKEKIKDICEEVNVWKGMYPISGFLEGKSSWKMLIMH